MALISTLTDNFNNNAIGAQWDVWKDSNGSVAETNGQIEITSGTTGTVTELYSVNKYDLTGSQATIKIIDAGDLTLTSYECRFVLYKDSSNWVRWSIKGDGDVIDVDFNVGGSASTKHSHSYVAATYRYLKIREASGTIYFDYSADGISWTNMYSDTNPFAVTSLEIDLDIRASGEVSTTTAKVDDFNILPSAWTKTFTDGITSTITFNRLFIGNRIFTETSSLVETLGKAEDKKLSDSCTFSGTLNKSPDKKLSDGITLNESLVKYVAKIMLETIGVVENIVTDIVKFLSLIFTTSVTFVENLFKDSDKKFVDTITANEELIKDFSRNLTETVGISTNIVKHAVKIVTESVTVNEAIVKSFEKYLIDSVALVETITTEKAVFKIISQFITDRGILTIDDLRSMKSDFPQLSMGDLKTMQRDFPSLTINDLQTMEQDIRRMLKDFK